MNVKNLTYSHDSSHGILSRCRSQSPIAAAAIGCPDNGLTAASDRGNALPRVFLNANP